MSWETAFAGQKGWSLKRGSTVYSGEWSPSYKAPLANGPPAYTAAFAVH